MKSLIEKIGKLEQSSIKEKIKQRLKDFESFSNKDTNDWFSELCFCILTANSKAKTALKTQDELGSDGFLKCSYNEIRDCIIRNKHRFHNNKTKFILEARKFINVKTIVTSIVKDKGEYGAREWLTKHVKGLGYKEASHFLRNIGYKNLAILDRHILNLMVENGYISAIPKSLSKKTYLETEKKFKTIADKLNMSLAELDLYMWYLKTNEVLK